MRSQSEMPVISENLVHARLGSLRGCGSPFSGLRGRWHCRSRLAETGVADPRNVRLSTEAKYRLQFLLIRPLSGAALVSVV
jgi:hypothetical protein